MKIMMRMMKKLMVRTTDYEFCKEGNFDAVLYCIHTFDILVIFENHVLKPVAPLYFLSSLPELLSGIICLIETWA